MACYIDPRVGTTSNSSWDGIHEGAHKGRRDFDDGANALWSLYGKMAETNDEARFLSLAGDMDAVGFFVRVSLQSSCSGCDLDSSTGIPLGCFIFCCSRLLPRSKYPEFAS